MLLRLRQAVLKVASIHVQKSSRVSNDGSIRGEQNVERVLTHLLMRLTTSSSLRLCSGEHT